MSAHPPSLDRRFSRTLIAVFVFACALAPPSGAAAQSKNAPADIFKATARMSGEGTAGEAYVTITIDRYTPQRDIDAMEQALKTGGSAAFVTALKKAPVAGSFKMGTQTTPIRWARQKEAPPGRVITIVTDAPVHFVGGAVPGAKPRAGFDVAVMQLTLDPAGVGRGTLAAAARVKPGGPSGVEVEDYASEPVKLAPVTRVIQ
jgi:hypothetical protein